jgi:hypothetical protein
MKVGCAAFGCHASITPAANLILEPMPNIDTTNLVDVLASHEHILDGTQDQCIAGELRIDTANPENSLIDGLPCDLWRTFELACNSFGCHSANTPAANLDLESPGVKARLVNVPATHLHILDGSQANCDPSELLVDVANPEQSLMLTKVLGTQSCGGLMPVLPRLFSSSDIACYTEWIYRLTGK